MSGSNWTPVDRTDFRKLRDARLLAHYAVQWLARFARGTLPAQPRDGQTGLVWDEGFGGLSTQPLPDGTRLGLRVADLTLAVLGGARQTLPLDGRADPEVRAWLGGVLATRGLDAGKLDAPLPYDMPPHVLALSARYAIEELIEPLQALAVWFADASGLLGSVQQGLVKQRLKAPPVRCWPRHFDSDTLVPLGGDRFVGAGFSPGDEFCDEPYFYISIYPEPYIPALPLLPPVGHWHSYKFIAALAPAHKIVASLDQRADVAGFFDVSIGAALAALATR